MNAEPDFDRENIAVDGVTRPRRSGLGSAGVPILEATEEEIRTHGFMTKPPLMRVTSDDEGKVVISECDPGKIRVVAEITPAQFRIIRAAGALLLLCAICLLILTSVVVTLAITL